MQYIIPASQVQPHYFLDGSETSSLLTDTSFLQEAGDKVEDLVSATDAQVAGQAFALQK